MVALVTRTDSRYGVDYLSLRVVLETLLAEKRENITYSRVEGSFPACGVTVIVHSRRIRPSQAFSISVSETEFSDGTLHTQLSVQINGEVELALRCLDFVRAFLTPEFFAAEAKGMHKLL